MEQIFAAWLGRVGYAAAWELQKIVAGLRAERKLPDTLLLLEHDPVYTLGRRGTGSEVLLDADELERRGIQVVESDRGGRVTYHGPGQLVGYPIVDLGVRGDVVAYVRTLERTMIRVASDFGVEAGTVDGLTGVWVGNAKLGAIGVHVSRGITTHGFALNVTTDLSAFNGIIPCGIIDRGVTSLAALSGHEVPMADVVASTVRRFGEAFGGTPVFAEWSVEELGRVQA